MGRVVKGAKVTGAAYVVRPPAIAPPRALPAPHDAYSDDPIFAELHGGGAEDFEAVVAHPSQTIDHEALRREAAAIIDGAHRDAEAILQTANERAAALVDEAERRGREIAQAARTEGLEQGTADGRAAAQAEMNEMLETMRGLVEATRSERHTVIESAEPEILKLSVTIAERILAAHLAADPSAVLDIVRAAIARLVNREKVTLRVNPGDVAMLRENRDQLMSMNDIDNLRIIEDQRVDRGGIVIETDGGNIDAKISTQLREVRRLLAVDDPLPTAPSSDAALINPPAQAS